MNKQYPGIRKNPPFPSEQAARSEAMQMHAAIALQHWTWALETLRQLVLVGTGGLAGTVALAAGSFFAGHGVFAAFSVLFYACCTAFAYHAIAMGAVRLGELADEHAAFLDADLERGRYIGRTPRLKSMELARFVSLALFLAGFCFMVLGTMDRLMGSTFIARLVS